MKRIATIALGAVVLVACGCGPANGGVQRQPPPGADQRASTPGAAQQPAGARATPTSTSQPGPLDVPSRAGHHARATPSHHQQPIAALLDDAAKALDGRPLERSALDLASEKLGEARERAGSASLPWLDGVARRLALAKHERGLGRFLHTALAHALRCDRAAHTMPPVPHLESDPRNVPPSLASALRRCALRGYRETARAAKDDDVRQLAAARLAGLGERPPNQTPLSISLSTPPDLSSVAALIAAPKPGGL